MKPALVINGLPAQYTHDFDSAVYNTIVDTVHATDATPVTGANIVDGLIQVRLLSYFLKTLKKRLVVLIGPRLTILTNASSVNPLQIRLCGFADSVTRHRAAFLP